MEIRNVTSIFFFSPTGSTRRLVSMLSKTFPSKPREVDITPYTQRGLKAWTLARMTLCYLASPYMEDAFPLRRCKRCAACRAAGRLPSWLPAYGNREI